MDPREQKIVDAAIEQFMRYGVRRTTMNDIASSAGVVRQTLYNVYDSKEAVLRAAMRRLTDIAVAAVECETAGAATLGDKLDIAFEHFALRPYDQINASPDAEDVISGVMNVAMEEIAEGDRRYRVALEQILKPRADAIRSSGMTVGALADLVQTSVKAFKHKAHDRKHLENLLASLKTMVLRVAGG
ncbi:MAG: TetR/AcrR family transcriptional regulator [Minwuia sp.]|uniref:TetR/AcrR family transcriptional regulator n=1 Tax=Minwuia sp. TaxID=2493630 RepID=UPI003A889C60